MTLDRALLESLVPEGQRRHVPATGEGIVFVPLDSPMPLRRVVLVFGSGSWNYDAYLELIDDVAPRVGAAVVTVTVPRHDHDHWGQFFYSSQLLVELRARGIVAVGAQVVVYGFSGGGKMAMIAGAFGGTDLWHAVLAAGVNEDTATMVRREHVNPTALDLPIVVMNGTRDDVVNGRTAEVVSSLRATGFRLVSLVTYDGRHEMPDALLVPELERLFD